MSGMLKSHGNYAVVGITDLSDTEIDSVEGAKLSEAAAVIGAAAACVPGVGEVVGPLCAGVALGAWLCGN